MNMQYLSFLLKRSVVYQFVVFTFTMLVIITLWSVPPTTS